MRQGAVPVTSGADLLEQWGIEKRDEGQETSDKRIEDCSPEEQKILELLNEPHERDELIRALAMPVHEASALLSAMEIKGLIKETMGELRLL